MAYEEVEDPDTWYARLRRIGEDIRALAGLRDSEETSSDTANLVTELEDLADEFRSAVLDDVTREDVDSAGISAAGNSRK